LPTDSDSRRAKRLPSTCGSGSPSGSRRACGYMPCGCRRGRTSIRNTSVKPEPGSRRGRMLAESAAVEEVPVWLEVNGEPAVTWMCTPALLEELATGWLRGEGSLDSLADSAMLRPGVADP